MVKFFKTSLLYGLLIVLSSALRNGRRRSPGLSPEP